METKAKELEQELLAGITGGKLDDSGRSSLRLFVKKNKKQDETLEHFFYRFGALLGRESQEYVRMIWDEV